MTLTILTRKKVLETIRQEMQAFSWLPIEEYTQIEDIASAIPQTCTKCIIFTNEKIQMVQKENCEIFIISIEIQLKMLSESGWQEQLGQTVLTTKQYHEVYEKWDISIIRSLIFSMMTFKILFKLLNSKIKSLVEGMMEQLEEYTYKDNNKVMNIFEEFRSFQQIDEIVYQNFYSPQQLSCILNKSDNTCILIIILDEIDLGNFLSMIRDEGRIINVYVCPKRNNYEGLKKKYEMVKWVDNII